MLIRGCHVTRYSYSLPVYCEPMILRLRPRENAAQRLERFHLEIWPMAAGMSEYTDLNGNTVCRAWFENTRQSMTITTRFDCRMNRGNPFDFVLRPDAMQLPVTYREDERRIASVYAKRASLAPEVERLAFDAIEATEGRTVSFLTHLTEWLRGRCEAIVRDTGDPWPAERTLLEGKGACRDTAVLFNEICRAAGLAARFVSGYSLLGEDPTQRYLHAWSEVFLPGAGWRGFDPSLGLAVADQHVAVAAAYDHVGAAPSHGNFRGTGVTSTLSNEIVLEEHR